MGSTPGQPHGIRISLCLIARDEEARLPVCLDSVANLADEIIVVDTGSQDDTREVADRYGAQVVAFLWCEDFAAARNECLRHARGEWIFWLDADEQLDKTNRRKLESLFQDLKAEDAAYLMRQVSPTGDLQGSEVAIDQVRLFRRDPAVAWEYRVHEQVRPSLCRAMHEVRRTDVVIRHGGLLDTVSSGDKLLRNLNLLERDGRERPDDPAVLYHLGVAYDRLGRSAEALPFLSRGLELAPPEHPLRPGLYAALSRATHRLNQPEQALAVCRRGTASYPEDVGLLFQEAVWLAERGDNAEAEAVLLRLLQVPDGEAVVSGDPGRRTYKARHLLAQVYRRKQRWTEAQVQLQAAIAERPLFQPAWQDLGEISLSLRRWPEIEWVAGHLDLLPAALLRLRMPGTRRIHGGPASAGTRCRPHTPGDCGPALA